MKEIVRLQNVFYEDLLNDYNLSAFENEIVYIQSLSYRSLHVLAELFSCDKQIQKGMVFFGGTPYETIDPMVLKHNRIVRVSFGEEFVGNLSIAENMMMNSETGQWKKLYHKKQNNRIVKEYLQEYGMDIDVEIPMWHCSNSEKRKLSILRAAMMQAKLIVLEVTSHTDEGYQSEEIIELIQRLHEKNISFLILASRYHPVCRIASRIQYVRYGMNIKEWISPDEHVFALMQDDILSSSFQGNVHQKKFTGLYDYQWTDEKNIWQYLHTVKEKNPDFWQKNISCSLPEEGISSDGETVIIPRTSFMELVETWTVKQNLTVAVSSRTTNAIGVIQKHLEDKICQDYYHKFKIDQKIERIDELNRLQKKILSIERFVLTRPKVIFLEDPYRSVHMRDVEALRAYLYDLSDQGIRIIYFSRSSETMQEDCNLIIQTRECKI